MIIEEKRLPKEASKGFGQKLVMEDRARLTVGGVENIENFSETTVILDTNMGRLMIKGENLHISKLNVDDGGFKLDGKINSLEYLKNASKKGSFFENIFR